MKWIRFAVFLSVFQLCAGKSSAYFDFNENCIKAYTAMGCLRINEANTLLNNELRLRPKNSAPILIASYVEFIKAFINEEKNTYALMKQHTKERLALLERADSSSPYYLYSIAEINLHMSTLHFRQNEYTTGFWELKRAYNLLNKNMRLHPGFKLNLKSLGTIKALLGSLPGEARFLLKMIGLRASIDEGIADLERLNASILQTEYSFFYPETSIIQALLYYYFLDNPQKALEIMDRFDKTLMGGKFSTSPLFLAVEADINRKLGQTDRGLELLERVPRDPEHFVFAYVDYLKGAMKLYRMDPDAHIYFLRYSQESKSQTYIKTVYQRIGWHFLLQGNEEKYREYMDFVKKLGNTESDDDKNAMKEAVSGEKPNVGLLRARLLCDGGYYNKALQVIGELDPKDYPKLKDKIEVTYRLGKIFQKMSNNVKALYYYNITIQTGSAEKYYFAAASAYESGLIYERMGNKKQAILSLKKCIDMKDHEQEGTLEQKSKWALMRLEED